MVDDKTPNLTLPLPSSGNSLATDVVRLRQALTLLDSVAAALQATTGSSIVALNTLQKAGEAIQALQAVTASNQPELNTLQKAVNAILALQATLATGTLTTASIGVQVQAYDAELNALAGLASEADRVPYFTGAGTAALATVTAAARGFLEAATAMSQRAALGLTIGTHVQAQSGNLSALAGLTSQANRVPVFTGHQTADLVAIVNAAGPIERAWTDTSTAVNKTLSAYESCLVTAAGKTLTLPATPVIGWPVRVIVTDFDDTVVARNGVPIMGLSENLTINAPRVAITLRYASVTEGWVLV